jgi:hypothetical protein
MRLPGGCIQPADEYYYCNRRWINDSYERIDVKRLTVTII